METTVYSAGSVLYAIIDNCISNVLHSGWEVQADGAAGPALLASAQCHARARAAQARPSEGLRGRRAVYPAHARSGAALLPTSPPCQHLPRTSTSIRSSRTRTPVRAPFSINPPSCVPSSCTVPFLYVLNRTLLMPDSIVVDSPVFSQLPTIPIRPRPPELPVESRLGPRSLLPGRRAVPGSIAS